MVVPVYNAMPYLTELVDSLLAQDLAADELEILLVDDGSTDDGPQVLDAYAERHPSVRVVHQANAGWPGPPRNHGLGLARGRYVFFADSDDRLGPEALRRMVQWADRHGSDIVLPKMVALAGRTVGAQIALDNLVDVDPEVAMPSLGPVKLFRRSMLLDHDIRFPEEKVRLEDGLVMAHAYYAARRISALVDYDYYFVRLREDGQNISMGLMDPAGYSWSVGEVAKRVRRYDPDPARADRVVTLLFRRKCLKIYRADRFENTSEQRRRAWVQAHQQVMTDHVSEAMVASLGFPLRQRAELVRAGDVEGLLALGRSEQEVGYQAHASEIGWTRRGDLRLVLALSGPRVPGKSLLLLRHRTTREVSRTPLQAAGSQLTALLPAAAGLAEGVWDVLVEGAPAETVPKVRVSTDPAVETMVGRGRLEPYRTANGNLSVRVIATPRRSLAVFSPVRRPLPAEITEVAVDAQTLTFRNDVLIPGRVTGLAAQLELRCTDPVARLRPATRLRRTGLQTWRVEATLDPADLDPCRSGLFGLWLELSDTRGAVRLRVPSHRARRSRSDLSGLRAELYTTSHGNLSLWCR